MGAAGNPIKRCASQDLFACENIATRRLATGNQHMNPDKYVRMIDPVDVSNIFITAGYDAWPSSNEAQDYRKLERTKESYGMNSSQELQACWDSLDGYRQRHEIAYESSRVSTAALWP
eukprot:scaffold162194_cov17-Prasinocladus_malaysianus.AAC.1